ncbi:restriction endonuclease subunit S [Microvirga sp. VF16]|uniref:restriction endonuclease subunit S n=1 Tax=Microvirga sp. VF16 TaxID=2807101 RepID=UPI00193CEEAB|nr:restriction endonuclease subunit S [Microvirga sp. VF16]QRM27895.1 restriction endonuclease subunit S [Microvirga sp. VF16]
MSHKVPNGWSEGAFERFITLQRGFDLPVQDRLPGDVPVYASNGVIGDHCEARISGPSVVTGRSGTLGKVFYYPDGCWPLNTTLYVRDFHGNDPNFVHRFLEHFDLQRFGTGTGVPTLNRNIVHKETVVFPPLSEQRQIAEILSSVDEAIQTTQAVIEQTRKVKGGVLKRLLTKGIGHTRFTRTEVGEIPEDWELVRIADVAAAKGGKRMPKGRPFATGVTPYPYIRVSDFRDGTISRESLVYVLPEDRELIRNYTISSQTCTFLSPVLLASPAWFRQILMALN